MSSQALTTINSILAVYALLLNVIGTLSSVLSLYVCFKLRKVATFVFLAYLTVANVFSLYYWLLNKFFNNFFPFDLSNLSRWTCRLGSFVQFSSLQISAWTLVLMSLDQFLSVVFRNWRTVHMKPRRAVLVSSALAGFFLLLNSNILFTFAIEVTTNDTSKIFCFEILDYPESLWMMHWGRVHLGLYSLIPFGCIAVTNTAMLIYLKFRRSKMNQNQVNPSNVHQTTVNSSTKTGSSRSQSRNQAMTASIVLLTVLFIVMTLPSAYVSFAYGFLVSLDYGRTVILICDCITFSYHGLNFYIYFLLNRRFRQELKQNLVQDLKKMFSKSQ
nr:G protein-coupled receptor [Proales similis]